MDTVSDRPRRFGKYRLIKKIGVGGMAEVYKAEYANDIAKPIAIKLILTDLSRDKKLTTMLVNEAKLVMMLDHPNIVPIYDFGLVEGRYFIAMEYIEGKDLRAFLKKAYSEGKTMPLEISLYITVSLLEGLAYAHEKRDNFNKPLEIIHRDISPQNIFISYDGEVKILDFGIAKAKGSLTETQAGILKGKFSYMSPEQAFGKEIDQRSDLFSTGTVFHELLTTRSLFGDQSEIRTIEKVRRANIPDPSKINFDVPKSLSKLVMKSLAKWRFRRFQTAAEFRDKLIDWGYKNGFMISKDLTKDYILKEFPRESDTTSFLNVSEYPETLGAAPDSKAKTGQLGISALIEDELKDFEKQHGIKSSPSETPYSVSSLHKSVPTYSVRAKISNLLTPKLIALLIILVTSLIVFSESGKINITPELFDKIYKNTVIKPREKIQKLRGLDKQVKEETLSFNPQQISKIKPKILFSEKAQGFVSDLPLEKSDRLIQALNDFLQNDKSDSLKDCKGKEPLSCMAFEDIRLGYIKNSEDADLQIFSIDKIKR